MDIQRSFKRFQYTGADMILKEWEAKRKAEEKIQAEKDAQLQAQRETELQAQREAEKELEVEAQKEAEREAEREAELEAALQAQLEEEEEMIKLLKAANVTVKSKKITN